MCKPRPSHINKRSVLITRCNPLHSSRPIDPYLMSSESKPFILGCEISADKSFLNVQFQDAIFEFHAQWLYDARYDDGAYRVLAFCQQAPTARIHAAHVNSQGIGSTLELAWQNGTKSQFPAPWLRAFAPLVAKQLTSDATQSRPRIHKGWKAQSLVIPEVKYETIFSHKSDSEGYSAAIERVLDYILNESSAGIVKIVDLPPPNVEDERNGRNTIVTAVMKQMFGSVFRHPVREPDTTFNIASHHEADVKKGIGLPNYDTNRLLLPHIDHSFYQHPTRVMGFYELEGESMNTFVSGLAAMETFKEEEPDLFQKFCKAPLSFGRVAFHYNPPIYQTAVDVPVTRDPVASDQIKQLRWHPHLSGPLLTPFHEFHDARRAHEKFLEIMRRGTHQLNITLKPGDLYLWDNFRVFHGRDGVSKTPRTGVGQTIPEQVAADTYRAIKMAQLKPYIDNKWLVHMTASQLDYLLQLMRGH